MRIWSTGAPSCSRWWPGARGVRLVVSDSHVGLRQAIAEVFLGASWQRCRVHFLRNVLSHVPKSAQAMVAATVRPIFQQQSRRRLKPNWLRYVSSWLLASPRSWRCSRTLGGDPRLL